MDREGADALDFRHLAIAPVELDDLSGSPCQVPIAAEATKPRLLGPRHDDIRTDPVFAVSDRYVLARFLAADRGDRSIHIFLDAYNAGLALRLVGDGHLTHAQKLPDQDRQRMRGAADATGEDPRQSLDRKSGGFFIYK